MQLSPHPGPLPQGAREPAAERAHISVNTLGLGLCLDRHLHVLVVHHEVMHKV